MKFMKYDIIFTISDCNYKQKENANPKAVNRKTDNEFV